MVEAVGAVVVDGVAAGRRLLDDLAGRARPAASALGSLLDPPPAVSSHCPARPLRSVVRSGHPGVERLLRHLLAGVVVVDGGWEEAVDVTLAFPDVVAVTRAGDRISSVGWRLGVGAPGVTRAALDEARTRALELAEARGRRPPGPGRRRRPRRGHRRHPVRGRGDGRRRPPPPTRRRRHHRPGRRPPGGGRDRRRPGPRDRTVDRIAQEAARVAELESLLPALDDDEAVGAARVTAERADRTRIQTRAEGLVALRAELEVRAAGLHDSRTALARRLAEVEDRLAGAAARRQESESPRAGLLATRAGLDRLGPFLDGRQAEVDTVLADLRQRRDAQVRALAEGVATLDGLRRRRQAAERRLGELRERAGRVELERPRPACGWRRPRSRCGASSTASRRTPWWPPAPRCRRAPAPPPGPATWSGSCGSWAR